MKYVFLNAMEIVSIHAAIINKYGGFEGIDNADGINTLIKTFQKSDDDDISALFRTIIEGFLSEKVFASANTRTAFAVADVFLRINGCYLVADGKYLEERIHLWSRLGPERGRVIQEDVRNWLVDTRAFSVEIPAATPSAMSDAMEDGFAARLRPDAVLPPRRPPAVPFPQAARNVFRFQQESVNTLKNVFREIRKGGRLQLDSVRHIVRDLVDLADQNADAMLAMYDLYTADAYTYRHCVNVATLAVGFGAFLGCDKQQLHWLGLAGFLHDVGKQFIPAEVINAPRKLTREEFLLMQRHPRLGYELLRRFQDIPEAIRRGVLEHHEKADGSGYPDKKRSGEISAVGSIISVVDVYDALSNERAYKVAEPPTRALSILYGMRNVFLPGLVERFIRCIGVYPVGSLVRLSSGEMAVVCEANPDAWAKPHVVPLGTLSTGEEHPRMLDLSGRSDVTVTDCLDPRRYGVDCPAVLKAAARFSDRET